MKRVETGEMQRTVERLCEVSVTHSVDPFTVLDWPDELDKAEWFTSPDLISIEGTGDWEALDETQRKVLSFYEAVNFYSLNIHGERMLIEGLAKRLYRKTTSVITPYLHHFLDEENKHMYYFGRFCTQYAGAIYPEKKIPFGGDFADGEEDFLFFGKVMVFEEIVDAFNRRQAKDERLNPLAREINRLHHFEEARHLKFGREIVGALWQEYRSGWNDDVVARVQATIRDYIGATWREYHNPAAYRDAGLDEPFRVRDRSLADAYCKERRRKLTSRLLKFLTDNQILTSAVEL